MDELLSDFLAEAAHGLEEMETALLRLEADPAARAPAQAALRQLHTIKGACGFLGLARLTALVEAGEALLSRALDGAPAASCELLLRSLDRMRGVIAGVRAHGIEPAGADDALLAEMAALTERLAAAPRARDPEKSAGGGERRTAVDGARLDAVADAALRLAESSVTLAREHAGAGEIAQAAVALAAEIELLQRRPISEAWRALPRLTRDAAAALGKQASIALEGEDIAIDAHLLEHIRAPLIHLVRNAVAHGIEPPEQRIARGKPAAGCVRVSAFVAGDQLAIDVADDGAGVSPAYLRRRGIERGLLGASEAARLGDEEALALMFAPGFSTAARLDPVAGRGVGLDAAKTIVERLGGALIVSPNPGTGAVFHIRLPLPPPRAAQLAPAPASVEIEQGPPVMVIAPNEPAHDRLAAYFAAAGYRVETVKPETAPATEKTARRREKRA